MASTKPCLFCGKAGVPLTKEHAIPRWISKLIDTRVRGGLTNTTVTSAGAMEWAHTAPEFDLQIRQVCAHCNNRWLNELERTFRAIVGHTLLGAIGPSHRFTPKEQRVIAVWSMKTYLLADYASASRPNRQRRMDRPSELLRFLRMENKPHLPASVWIGAVDWTSEALAMAIGSRNVFDQHGRFIGTIGFLSIAAWVIAVYIAGWSKGTERPDYFVGLSAPPPEFSPYLHQVWPVGREGVPWPPTHVLTTEKLKSYIDAADPIVVEVIE